MVVALLALFIALDGPATAKRLIDGGSIKPSSITSRQVRNRSLGAQDLSRAATRTLQQTPAGSVGTKQLAAKSVDATKLADGAVGTGVLAPKAVDGTKLSDSSVGPVQLAPDSVTSSRIADGAVGSAAIADGSLMGPDVADFFGSVTSDFAPFAPHTCQTVTVASPTPTSNPEAKISDDVIIVTPGQAGFSDVLTLAGYPGAGNSLRIVACRVDDSMATVDPDVTRFFYLGIDAP